MSSRRLRLRIIIAVLLLIVLNVLPALAQCKSKTAAVKQLDQLRQGRSLSIRLFSIAGSTIYKAEPLENLRIALAERLREELQASKYFSSVVILPEDKQPQSDLVLEGEFTEIDEGNRAGRILSGTGEARLGIRGKLVTTKTSETAFEFECFRATAGGPLGTGGWLAGSGKKLIHDLIEDLAESLKKVIPEFGKKMEKRAVAATNLANASFPPIIAEQQRVHDLPKKPPEQWSWKDCSNIIFTFTVYSSRKPEGTVGAQWLAAPSYQAHRRVWDLLLAAKAKLKAEKDAIAGMEFYESLMPMQERLKEMEKEDVYLLLLMFVQKDIVHWNHEKTEAVTFLKHTDRSNERIQPLRMVSSPSLEYSQYGWAVSSVIFVFPTKMANGKPIVENMNERLELYTEVENRPIVIRFDLGRFGLKRTEELKLKPEA